MDPGEERINPTVGEIPQKNGRSRGQNNPRMNGTGFCGTEQDWTEGALYGDPHVPPAVDADGFPLCCPQLPMQGGIELNGAADQGVAMSGGGEVAGEGSDAFAFEYTPDGGGEVGGKADIVTTKIVRMDGGIECDGESPPPPRPIGPAISSVEVGGEGGRPTYREIAPDGGLTITGEGDQAVYRVIVADGGGEVGGSGLTPLLTPIHAVGGIEVDGEGSTPLLSEIHAEGGVEVGDESGILVTRIHPDGGVEVGAGGAQLEPTPANVCTDVVLPSQLWTNWIFDPTHSSNDVFFTFDYHEDDADWNLRFDVGMGLGFVRMDFFCDGDFPGKMSLRLRIESTGFDQTHQSVQFIRGDGTWSWSFTFTFSSSLIIIGSTTATVTILVRLPGGDFPGP
jgi:hypothetical protein